MFKHWRVGKVLGFPVDVSVTFLFLLVFVLLWRGGLVGVAIVGVAFASVLLHELGHAVVARRLGVPVESITLSFFGGAAKMVDLPRTGNHELLIAAAGPVVSLVLAGVGLGLGAITGVFAIALVGWINLVIALFNLLPALPMDGGRILRALLSRRYDYVRATDVSVTVARGISLAVAAFALAQGQVQLLILVPLLWWMGSRERLVARMIAHRVRQTPNGYVMRSADEPEVMPAGFGFGAGFDRHAQRPAPRVVIRRKDGTLVFEID